MRSFLLTLARFAALVLASSQLHASGVRIVSAPGAPRFQDIQSAVNAAADGDVLLVAAGTYAPFTIQGKGVALYAAPNATVNVTGQVQVTGVGAGKTVVIRGLNVTDPTAFYLTRPAIQIDGCAGIVRLEACTGKAYDQGFVWTCQDQTHDGGLGLLVSNSTSVTLAACSFTGGKGEGVDNDQAQNCTNTRPGGPGIRITGSTVAIYDTTATGGRGGEKHNSNYGQGGSGLDFVSGTAIASGSTFTGGQGGGNGNLPYCNGPGGAGITFGASAILYEIGCVISGGPANQCFPSSPTVTGGAPISWPGPARRMTIAPAVIADLSSWTVSYSGAAGDAAFLLSSLPPDFVVYVAFSGVLQVKRSQLLPSVVLGSGGSISTQVATGDVSGAPCEIRYAQVAARASGSAILGSGTSLLVLDRASGPDCDGNGTNDLVDVIANPSLDSNSNLVPDSCESPNLTWYVDASAPPGGNGSPAAPFATLDMAFGAAFSGNTILVADGTYSGVRNRDLDFAGRTLVVRSLNGPVNCVIDCQRAGRAFLVDGTVGPAGRIEGFTIRNGQQTNGGGIYVRNASPTIVNCNVFDCIAGDMGGGLYLESSSSLVRDCAFTGNRVTWGGGLGAGIRVSGGQSRIAYCYIAENQAARGAGIYVALFGGTTTARVEACTIIDNLATWNGGAIGVGSSVATGIAYVTDCLIAGNRADSGGGCQADFGSEVRIDNTTIVDNAASTSGGALRAVSNGFLNVSNCVLDGNSAPAAPQIELAASSGRATLRSTDLRGGSSTVSVCATCTYTLGAGMIDADPLFADRDGPDNQILTSGDNDYRLLPGSPCIDAGDNSLVPTDGGDLDLDGNTTELLPWDLDAVPRFIDDPAPDTGIGAAPIVDMGCYEKHP